MRLGMEMEGFGRVIQLLMIVSNFVVWIGSVAVLVLGVWAVVDRSYLDDVIGSTAYIATAYILMSVGVASFIISFFGFFGALKEIKCMLLMYFFIMLLLFIMLLVGGILGIVFQSQAQHKLRIGMLRSMRNYNTNTDYPVTMSWDAAQRGMQCCGIDDRDDWSKNNKFFREALRVPMSCCAVSDTKTINCTRQPNDANSFKEGCLKKAITFVSKHAQYLGGAGIGVSILMALGVVFSISLFSLIK